MIRAATAADLDGLVRLNREVQAFHVDVEPETYRATDVGEVRAWLTRVLAEPGTRTFVWDDRGELLGFVVTRVRRYENDPYVHDRVSLHVDQLGVTARARRRGVGRALMEAVHALADALDVDAVQLDVRAVNHGARTFYEALGYTPARIAMRRMRR